MRRVYPQDLRDPQQRAQNADRSPVPVGLGPVLIKPSQPQNLGGNPERRISLPAEDFPPAGAIPVDVINEADVASAAPAATVITTIRVPDNRTFRIAGLGFGAEDESGLRFLSWTLKETPPAGTIWNYVDMPAAIGSIGRPAWVFIVLGSSVVFTVEVTTNGPVGTYHYFCHVQGWFYQEEVAR